VGKRITAQRPMRFVQCERCKRAAAFRKWRRMFVCQQCYTVLRTEFHTARKPNPPKQPPPGSDAAVALGCRCSVTNNRRGQGFSVSATGAPYFWINFACPIHNAPDADDDTDNADGEARPWSW